MGRVVNLNYGDRNEGLVYWKVVGVIVDVKK